MSERDAAICPTHHVVTCLGGARTRLEQRPIPAPAVGELLLRLRVVGLVRDRPVQAGHGRRDAPGLVLGHELVGEVLELADKASRGFRPRAIAWRSRITCPAATARSAGAAARRCAPRSARTCSSPAASPTTWWCARARSQPCRAPSCPAGLSDDAAVFMEPAACVLRGIDRATLARAGHRRGARCAGSMGLLHLLVLRAMHPGLTVVIMVDPREDRRSRRRAASARTASTASGRSHRHRGMRARRRPQGLGADAVFDTVGGARACCEQALSAEPRGRRTVVLFAHAG